MADQQLAVHDEEGIITILRGVLEPLGQERVEQIVSWVKREIHTRPLVAYCWDAHLDAAWEITKDSPISEGRTVFAMLHWEAQRAVVAYCFKKIEVGGREAVQFFRELIMDPKHITGPVSHNALFEDLRATLAEAEAAALVEGFLDHVKPKLDPKTFEKLVEACDDFPPLAALDDGAPMQANGEA